MVARSTLLLVLITELLLYNLHYCSAENVYCVTPTATSCSSCPPNSINCTTLNEYAQEAEMYFTSNTTMVFLPGDHALDTNITVANVVRLTICGESSSGNRTTVVCKGSVGLTFTSTKDLKLCSLAFTFCSRNYGSSNYLLPSNYALLLQSAQYAELVNCSFRVNIGSALIVDNTNVTLAGNSEFTHTHCTCASNSCTGGRGLTAYSSNLTFIGNTTFLENSALSFNGGGAIHADNTILTFQGTSNFISNSADFGGGAISTTDNTIIAFNGISNFIGNSAIYGGAICTDITTTLIFNGTTNFFNNGHYPGRTGTVILNGNTTYGGGVFMTPNTFLLIFPNATIYWANNHTTFGGAIYVADATELSYCTSIQKECFFQLPGQNLSSINATCFQEQLCRCCRKCVIRRCNR